MPPRGELSIGALARCVLEREVRRIQRMEGQTHRYVETTLLELVTVIDEVVETEEEAFAVLESMLAEGRISVVGGNAR